MSVYRKAVVFGGSGMIGTRVVAQLRDAGLDVLAASRRSGVDTLTGKGLAEALKDADLAVDTSDVPSFDAETLRTFFRSSGENIFAAERAAGVKHHVTLSIVGVDRVRGNPYFDAKLIQEEMAMAAGVPFTIVRSTQFFEFFPTIADGFTKGGVTALPDAQFRPIAADDVATGIARIALGEPRNGEASITGPESASFAAWLKRLYDRTGDTREAVADRGATYFGAPLQTHSIVPDNPDFVGRIGFDEWFRTPAAKAALGGDRYGDAAKAIGGHGSH